jgi:hypothetical protein
VGEREGGKMRGWEHKRMEKDRDWGCIGRLHEEMEDEDEGHRDSLACSLAYLLVGLHVFFA